MKVYWICFKMQQNKERDDTNKISVPNDKELKTQAEYPTCERKSTRCDFPGSAATFSHYISIFILGLLVWGVLWIAFGDSWRWDGPWFRIAAVAVVAWTTGRILHGITTLPPLLAALLIGILAKHFGVLDMRNFTHIDAFFRKIYPVLILGKGSLAWDMTYMKQNWKQVAALGILPWSSEVLVMTICTHQLLGFPWIWGVLVGAVYASVSCPVIMPSVQRAGAGAGAGAGAKAGRDWPQLVCTAGGTDTALSVGVYGLVLTYIFSDNEDVYRYVKAALALFVGVAGGVAWGCVSGLVPHSRDYYVNELRVLFVLLGGLLGNFLTAHLGWGGTGGVAVLACNATAAACWKRDGWQLNSNAASTAYRVLWAAAEPLVFAFTGTFFEISPATGETLLKGLLILTICLAVRLAVAFLVCWDMTLREKIFVCCAWTPKSIVEAVLCPVAINAALMSQSSEDQKSYAEDVLRLLVEAIAITTPIGFLLTHYLGPWLLADKMEDVENDRKTDLQSQTQRKKSQVSTGSCNEDVRF